MLVCTKQGNKGIYVQINDWKEKYATNIHVIDEVTGRMYANMGGTIQWIPEIGS